MSEETKVRKPSLIGMVTNPLQQFERIREIPLIWRAMTIAIIFTAVGVWLRNLAEEDVTSVIDTTLLLATVSGSVIGRLLGVFIISYIHMLISVIAPSTVTFRQLFSMNTYILTISALGLIVNGIVVAVIGGDPEVMATSLSSVMRADGAMASLWNSIEVFSIWSSILTALGLEKVAGFSKTLSWAIAIVFFMIGIILEVNV